MSDEKTEAPTAKRLDEARRRGEVPRSRDLVAFASLVAVFALATHTAPRVVASFASLLTSVLDHIARPPSESVVLVVTERGLSVFAVSLFPLVFAPLVLGAVTAYLDAGPVLAWSRVLPKASRIDPFVGARQLFTRERFVELAKSLVALVAIAWVVVDVLVEAAPSLPRLVTADAARGLAVTGTLASRIVARVLVVLAAIAVFDVVSSRRLFLRGQRMTKDEVKREHKDAEGDPHHKGERARMHREIVEHSVLEGVRRADVLVVNPTHLAIALRFDEASDQNAPEVVAKGEDELARRMIEAAREAGVPVMRDIPLARSLYALDLGDEIPEPLFEAVAAVLRAAWAERESGG